MTAPMPATPQTTIAGVPTRNAAALLTDKTDQAVARANQIKKQAAIDSKREKEQFPPIKLERTNVSKLSHEDGTISMARDGPDTATSDFFICIGDQPSLDQGGRRNPDGRFHSTAPGAAVARPAGRGRPAARATPGPRTDGPRFRSAEPTGRPDAGRARGPAPPPIS